MKSSTYRNAMNAIDPAGYNWRLIFRHAVQPAREGLQPCGDAAVRARALVERWGERCRSWNPLRPPPPEKSWSVSRETKGVIHSLTKLVLLFVPDLDVVNGGRLGAVV